MRSEVVSCVGRAGCYIANGHHGVSVVLQRIMDYEHQQWSSPPALCPPQLSSTAYTNLSRLALLLLKDMLDCDLMLLSHKHSILGLVLITFDSRDIVFLLVLVGRDPQTIQRLLTSSQHQTVSIYNGSSN